LIGPVASKPAPKDSQTTSANEIISIKEFAMKNRIVLAVTVLLIAVAVMVTAGLKTEKYFALDVFADMSLDDREASLRGILAGIKDKEANLGLITYGNIQAGLSGNEIMYVAQMDENGEIVSGFVIIYDNGCVFADGVPCMINDEPSVSAFKAAEANMTKSMPQPGQFCPVPPELFVSQNI
jgi:hypothetical protein